MKKPWLVTWTFLCLVFFLSTTSGADPSPPFSNSLTLTQAIRFALDHYPAVRESLAKHQEAQSGISLAQTTYLPRVEIGVQGTRSTFNNVSGMFFPNPFFNRFPVLI